MIVSEEYKKRFLNIVCPECIKLAKNFIDGKIDASYVGCDWYPYEWHPYGVKKRCCNPGQVFMAIYEETLGPTPKIIMFNINAYLRSITDDDIDLIRQVTRRYGNRSEYDLLVKSDKDETLRWKMMKK